MSSRKNPAAADYDNLLIQRPILLGSSSPYRKKLFETLMLNFDTASPDIDETFELGENPEALCCRLAVEKAQSLKNRFPDHLIIGSDQVAMLDNKHLRKPKTRGNTIAQLVESSGQAVQFFTSVCVLDAKSNRMASRTDICRVYFRRLKRKQIVNYVDRERPYDCAGGFKAEGLGIALFEKFEGQDPNALIGLPLIRLCGLLQQFGVNVI